MAHENTAHDTTATARPIGRRPHRDAILAVGVVLSLLASSAACIAAFGVRDAQEPAGIEWLRPLRWPPADVLDFPPVRSLDDWPFVREREESPVEQAGERR